MPQVNVVNKNTYPYKEEWDGRIIDIPPGGKIVMAREEAVLFLGRANPITRDADGNPRPESYKRLYIEKIDPTADQTPATQVKGK